MNGSGKAVQKCGATARRHQKLPCRCQARTGEFLV